MDSALRFIMDKYGVPVTVLQSQTSADSVLPIPERGTAVVVGASLAGLSLAISLARSGLAVTVLERASGERSGGTGLRLWGGRDETVARRDGSGIRVPTIASIASAGVPGPEGWATVYRRLLDAAAAEPGVTIRHETEVVEVGQDADTAWAKDTTGTIYEADILVGADGHRSVVRRSVDPAHPDATYAGYAVWTGRVPYEAAPGWQEDRNYMNMITLPNGDGSMIVGETQTSGNPRRYFWQWYDPTSDDYLREAGALIGKVSQYSLVNEDIAESKYEEIYRRAAHWPAPWDDIVRYSVSQRTIIATPITEYVPQRLTRGRIAIIGDAAHVPSPMTGAGFDTGLDDAETLGELTSHGVIGEQGTKVLRVYEEQRLEIVQEMVRSGQVFGHHLLDSTGVHKLSNYLAQARSSSVPQVVLLCGMTGSGKTTMAAELERALPAIRFSIDDWMIELFGHEMTREQFDERHDAIKELLWRAVERLVALHVNVVLDFGFWRAEERADAAQRAAAAGGEPVVVFLNAPVKTLEQRLKRRNANLPPGTFEVTKEMLDMFLSKFEAPSPDEALKIIEIYDDEQGVTR